MAQSWDNLLYTTDEKLEISKCGIYIMEWEFHDDGRVILAPMSDIEPFTITSSFDKSHYLIKLLSNNEYMKYLGIQSTPAGNQDSQFHSSITTAELGARTLDTNPFGRYNAKLYLNTHLNTKLYYPFTCSSLSNQQYIDINKTHIPSSLSSMGFNRTWPLSLRFGCHSYGGIQLNHSQVEAIIKKINVIQSIRSKSDTAPVFHIVLS